MAIQISTQWYLDLDSKAKEEFKKIYNTMGHDPLLLQLQKVLENELLQLYTPREDDYKNDSFAYLQAYRNGQIKAIQNVLKLLPTNKDK